MILIDEDIDFDPAEGGPIDQHEGGRFSEADLGKRDFSNHSFCDFF